MTIAFYEHPFSSYVQKAYEKGILFESKMIDGSEPVASEFAALWPIQRFPVIVDDGQFVFEATGIIEYLEARFPETARLIPPDLPLAAEVRMWDRFFDNYVSYPQGRLVFMAIGREPDDGKGGAAWKSMLETRTSRPPHGRSDLGGRGELQPRRLRGSIAGGGPKNIRLTARLSHITA